MKTEDLWRIDFWESLHVILEHAQLLGAESIVNGDFGNIKDTVKGIDPTFGSPQLGMMVVTVDKCMATGLRIFLEGNDTTSRLKSI